MKHLTTSVMHNHMHLKHPFVTMSAQAPPAVDNTQTQPPITAVFNSKTPYTHNHPTAKQITETLGEMICQDLLPYSIVENTGFRKLLTVTAPCYRVPSRMHFSRTVGPNLYCDVKAKVRKSLLSMEGDVVHCTTDIWTSWGVQTVHKT